jgi:hypothetical protein
MSQYIQSDVNIKICIRKRYIRVRDADYIISKIFCVSVELKVQPPALSRYEDYTIWSRIGGLCDL